MRFVSVHDLGDKSADIWRELWDSVHPSEQVFDPGMLADYPAPARRYLEYAIEPGTRLASAVRLSMSGEIKLNKWLPFEAEQVLVWPRGFVWRATVRMGIVRMKGFDRLVDGQARMRWKLLGIIPFMNASGPDIDRSAAGRLGVECVWLPSAPFLHASEWREVGPADLSVTLPVAEQRIETALALGPSGEVRSVSLERWGRPDTSQGYGLTSFGGIVDEERSFGGYTIPSKLRAGWYLGSERFASEGEFFRCRIETAEFK